MHATGTSKKAKGRLKQAVLSTFLLTAFIWSVFLSCWCGPECPDTAYSGLSAAPINANHGCCPSEVPVEQEPGDDCCADPNGFHCCTDDVAEHKLAQTNDGASFEFNLVLLDVPEFMEPAKPDLHVYSHTTLPAAAHGPPVYLQLEIFLI